ncbi:hypothetical protein HJC22_31450 [Corallococcus exiguus]|uniref:hypothetical protein n=1 Tax=Corallococcus exiguus TaxID=83462 RepID=UPI0014708D3D|nr:hypothetical protein [Corallococcus exiguus]NNC20246.1 hypothetical protein [Corallococcus exiguus]
MPADAFAQQVRQHLTSLQVASDAILEPLLEAFRQLDPEPEILALKGALEKSFAMYAGKVSAVDRLSVLQFSWIGADVAPWVPTQAWGAGYAGHTLQDGEFRPERVLFRELEGFDPSPLPLLGDAAEDPAVQDHARFDELRSLFLLRSFEWTSLALARAVDSPEFRGLPTTAPFYFLGRGGHDEPRVLLHAILAR